MHRDESVCACKEKKTPRAIPAVFILLSALCFLSSEVCTGENEAAGEGNAGEKGTGKSGTESETSAKKPTIYTAAEMIRRSRAILRARLEKLPQSAADARYEPAVLNASEVIKGRKSFERTHVLMRKGMLPDGAKGVFFLWETAEKSGEREEHAYLLNHPQNFYDDSLADIIRYAVEHPGTLGESDYFREWDRKRASAMAGSEGDSALLADDIPAERKGLAIEAGGFFPAAIGDNSFRLTFTLKNTSDSLIHVYDSADTGFRLRLRKKDAPAADKGAILRPDDGGILKGLDLDLSQYVTELDFQTIAPGASLTRDLYFSSAQYPALRELNGAYLLTAIYFSRQDGRQVKLKAWTGIIASRPVEVIFKPVGAK